MLSLGLANEEGGFLGGWCCGGLLSSLANMSSTFEGVGEKGADSAPALSNMWGKKHDRRGLDVVMDIC